MTPYAATPVLPARRRRIKLNRIITMPEEASVISAGIPVDIIPAILLIPDTHFAKWKVCFMLSVDKIGRQNGKADNRRETRCQNSAENPHFKRKNEDVIKNDIGKAAGHHCSHGKRGIPVIAHKALQKVICQKSRRKEQHHLQVGVCHRKNRSIGTQQRYEATSTAKSR